MQARTHKRLKNRTQDPLAKPITTESSIVMNQKLSLSLFFLLLKKVIPLQKKYCDMNWNNLSNSAIIEEVGKRLKEYRFQRKLTQQELADQAGISLFSVTQIEKGKAVTLTLFLSVLRVLRLLDNFELLIPEIGISPIELLKLRGKTPKRVKKSKKQSV